MLIILNGNNHTFYGEKYRSIPVPAEKLTGLVSFLLEVFRKMFSRFLLKKSFLKTF